MHILYIDESGSTGERLDDPEQPVFAMGGIVVRDEGWRKTNAEIQRILNAAFDDAVPSGFELHAGDLLSPDGAGPFAEWETERRTALALDLLNLLATRKHQAVLQVYDKTRLADTAQPPPKVTFPWSDPWELAFAMFLTTFEEFLRSPSTGSSSAGLIVIDHEDRYLETVREHSRVRTSGKGWREVRKVVEIGYSAVSHANPMIQLADLVTFTMRKHAEVAAGYKDSYPQDAKDFFKNCYAAVWPRTQFKTLSFKKVPVPSELVEYVKLVRVF